MVEKKARRRVVDWRAAARMWRAGEDPDVIAERFGVTRATVNRRLSGERRDGPPPLERRLGAAFEREFTRIDALLDGGNAPEAEKRGRALFALGRAASVFLPLMRGGDADAKEDDAVDAIRARLERRLVQLLEAEGDGDGAPADPARDREPER